MPITTNHVLSANAQTLLDRLYVLRDCHAPKSLTPDEAYLAAHELIRFIEKTNHPCKEIYIDHLMNMALLL